MDVNLEFAGLVDRGVKQSEKTLHHVWLVFLTEGSCTGAAIRGRKGIPDE